MMQLNLSSIRIDGDTQARLSLDQQVVDQYAEHMLDGDKFPPVIVFHDGSDHWLADGFHRYFATKANAQENIEAELKTGTLQDARLYAFGANSRRGLSMTDGDNRSIIAKMLQNSTWSNWTNAEIARHVGVSKMTVGRVKNAMPADEKNTKKVYTNRYGKESTIETKNIGRKKVEEKPEEGEQNTDQLNELTETISSLSTENQALKDKVSIGQWDASDIEKLDIQDVVLELRENIRVLEIDNKALRESRDMYQNRNAEMIRTINGLKAQIKKLDK
jgi:hypothetical protein